MDMKNLIRHGFVFITCVALNSFSFAETLNSAANYTDRIIVKYKDQLVSPQNFETNSSGISVPGASIMSQYSAATGMDIQYVKALSIPNSHVVKLDRFETLSDIQTIANELMANDSSIAYAEPDVRMFPLAVPNDPAYVDQWHLQSSASHGMNLPGAWNITTGSSSVVIAVIDTGILPDHPDLAGRILPGYDMITDITMANDGNGRDSDPADPGDWSDGIGCPPGNSSWHGTHVAGTIGAATNNGVGVAGVDWSAKILPIRALGKCGGYTSDISDGISWAAGLAVSGVPVNGNPADVINMSLGGFSVCDTTTQTAINNAVAAGTTIVVAAGNNNDNASSYSPASCNNVITVGAHGDDSTKTSYSNYGTSVDIMAPGGHFTNCPYGVKSTYNSGTTVPGSHTYDCIVGTSMASPHVAGLVSLILAVDPSLTPTEIEALIKNNSRGFVTSGTCDLNANYCGAGIADAAATITAVLNSLTPAAPSNVSLDPSVSNQITVSWTDNASNETGFKVARSINGVDFTIIYTGTTADESSYLDSTATDGLEYFYSVTAYNTNGSSATAYSPNTTPTLPAPSNLSATVVSGTQINLTWTDNSSLEDNMKVERSTDGNNYSPLVTLGANSSSYSNTGLTSGTTYYYRVYADNASLTSDYSNTASATTSAAPSILAPTNLTATASSSSRITVRWTENAINEENYIAEMSYDGINFQNIALLPANTIGFEYAGLDPSTTYYFRVYATDNVNDSDSDYSNIGSATTLERKSGGSSDWFILGLLSILVVSRMTLKRKTGH